MPNESNSARTPHDKATLRVQVTATDRQIDRLAYELCGLTEEEIRMVEEGWRGEDRSEFVLASAARGRLLRRQLHVRAAPADDEVHHVRPGVFLGLTVGLPQRLPGALEQRAEKGSCVI